MQMILLFALAAALVVLTGYVLNIAAGLAVLIAAGLVLTWYFADDEPLFGPANANRVPFKRVLQNFLGDVVELLRLDSIARWAVCRMRRQWMFWGPRVTNRALYVAAIADLTLLFGNNGGPFTQVIEHPIAFAGVVLLNLLTPLTPPSAPPRIPAPPETRGMNLA